MTVRVETEAEKRTSKKDEERFRKVKSYKAHDNNAWERVSEDAAREKNPKGEAAREESDDEETRHLLFMLKRRDGLVADEAGGAQESE